MLETVAILIPAYNPNEELCKLIAALKGECGHLVVVNDGSTRGENVFEAIRPEVDCVLTHPTNRGKGAAVKTGLGWTRDHLGGVQVVVTADSDGQHRPHDIRRVAEMSLAHPTGLVLGVREFAGKVPFRSRLGNTWTRGLFRLLTGLALRDTQTGLRGIPRALFDRLLRIPGERYEYEARMLVDCRNHPSKPLQVPIETVYIEGNQSSHYRPIRDTLLTQWALWSARFGRTQSTGRGSDVLD